MWMSLVEMKVWMRGRSESLTAFQAASMSWTPGPRQTADDRAMDLAGDRLDGLEVARRGDREAGLDDVHAEARELVRDLQLLVLVERDPRRLLPVAQGGVEDLYSVLLAAVHVLLLFVGPTWFSLGLRLAAATRYSPRRGRRRRRRRSARHDMEREAYRVVTGSEHDLADVAALVQVAVRRRAVLERERLCHDRADVALLEPARQRLDVLVERVLGVPQHEHVEADHRLRLAHQPHDVVPWHLGQRPAARAAGCAARRTGSRRRRSRPAARPGAAGRSSCGSCARRARRARGRAAASRRRCGAPP